MKISVFGLGYVGAVSAGCLARDGHGVLGCDIDAAKLSLFRSGRTPVIEQGMDELIAGTVASGRLTVTDDVAAALRATELSFICVGTPSNPNGSQDLTAVTRISRQLGEALRDERSYHALVVRSTVLPGTVEGTILPILEEASGKRAGVDFGIGFQPEFLREGSSIRDYDNPPFSVVGTADDRCAEMIRGLFAHLPGEFVRTTVGTAEMLKYCCNAFHALKISFANEVGRIAQSFGADPHAVMELVCRDRQLNISPAYLKPGFAFGGSCLPKDLRALLYAARRNDVSVPMLSGILPSNRVHVDHAIDLVLRHEGRAVGMLGLSFKPGTDDLRESPLVAMAERFLGKGLKLRIYDSEVSLARLVGANRKYIEESIPHISSVMTASLEELVSGSDVLVVGRGSRELVEPIYRLGREDQLLLDLVGIEQPERVRGRYVGVCW